MKTEQIRQLMRLAIQLSLESVNNGGGPFGAVIVKNGAVVATGSNEVTLHNDPTAHAEISAIRAAAQTLETFNLSGCEIYSSCEPCPMCLAAIYWSKIDKIYYANTEADAGNIGFDDSFLYEEMKLKPVERSLPSFQLLHEEAIKVFEVWQAKADKINY